MSFNGIKIDNRTSTLEENKEIKILKINFPSTHIHSTYNTQAYKRKLKTSEKFQRIWNTEKTYLRPISNQTSLVPDKPSNSTLTPIEGIEKIKCKNENKKIKNL